MPGQKTRVNNGPVGVEYDVEDLGPNGNLRHGGIEEELAIIRASIRKFLFEVICVVLHSVNKGEPELLQPLKNRFRRCLVSLESLNLSSSPIAAGDSQRTISPHYPVSNGQVTLRAGSLLDTQRCPPSRHTSILSTWSQKACEETLRTTTIRLDPGCQ